MKKISLLLLFTILCVCLTGCPSANPKGLYSVSGSIKLDGAPLTFGMISFVPKSGGSLGSQCAIKEGRYSLTGESSLAPGEYLVRIVAVKEYDKKTKEPATPSTDIGNIVSESLVPDKYNKKTELHYTITADKTNVYDIELKSK